MTYSYELIQHNTQNRNAYTLWLFNVAMENCPFIDDFPIKTSIYKDFPWLC